MEPWEERSDGSAVEISFEGFDADKRDLEEAREFVTVHRLVRRSRELPRRVLLGDERKLA